MLGNCYSNDSNELPQDAKKLAEIRHPVIARKHLKPIRLHLHQQFTVDRAHDFSADHGTAILSRQNCRRPAEMLVGSVRLER